jgi:hypothetical protein
MLYAKDRFIPETPVRAIQSDLPLVLAPPDNQTESDNPRRD